MAKAMAKYFECEDNPDKNFEVLEEVFYLDWFDLTQIYNKRLNFKQLNFNIKSQWKYSQWESRLLFTATILTATY